MLDRSIIHYMREQKDSKKSPIVVVVSGGFDPVHVGHVRLFEEAKKLGVAILRESEFLKILEK